MSACGAVSSEVTRFQKKWMGFVMLKSIYYFRLTSTETGRCFQRVQGVSQPFGKLRTKELIR